MIEITQCIDAFSEAIDSGHGNIFFAWLNKLLRHFVALYPQLSTGLQFYSVILFYPACSENINACQCQNCKADNFYALGAKMKIIAIVETDQGDAA